ncbi:MAG: acylphosphatase [Gammaproteobacteria bacterium]|nr:acylphosphatase [Gammaproteobacteria bacterium]
MVCKRFLVSGRVQGVFFRGSTAQEAGRLGLSGSAVNLADGRVEVLAKGPSAAIDELAAWLRHGPRWASVDDVQVIVEDASATDVPAGFTTG